MAQIALLKAQNRAAHKGSDPRIATCRGKLQNKRSKLNQEINKELRLRAGAENLFKATTNRKLKETVALELSFVNSNLQLLKEQLSVLNSSVEIYQNDTCDPIMPMIPLGLKETKEIDLKEPFKDFILEHYSEDGTLYEDAIVELMDLRQAMRTPLRDMSGICLLFQYYNQLYFVERRFFPPDRSLGIYFEWYDSLTGVPSCQRTVAFEKACVLFNMAAVYTQIGAKQDRCCEQGLDDSVDYFLRAAGTFRYICDNFTNAPSQDLNCDMLEMLSQLMMTQARECLLEKLTLEHDKKKFEKCEEVKSLLELSSESAQVSHCYQCVEKQMKMLSDCIPFTWMSLVSVKCEYYLGLAHRYAAVTILEHPVQSVSQSDCHCLVFDVDLPKEEDEMILFGRAHLRESVLKFEEAQRLHRMCRELRNKPGLAALLKKNYEETMESFTNTEDENDFREILDSPVVRPSSKFQLTLTPPDFSQHRVDDLFRKLGPCAVFSAKHHWTAPRLVQLQRTDDREGFGFTVRGGSPGIVAGVDANSLADFGGMKEGDYIVAIGDYDVKRCPHEEVIQLIKQAGDALTLRLVTPMDKHDNNKCKKIGSVSGSSSSSGVSSNHSWSINQSTRSGYDSTRSAWLSDRHVKKLTWNPFKKHSSYENILMR